MLARKSFGMKREFFSCCGLRQGQAVFIDQSLSSGLSKWVVGWEWKHPLWRDREVGCGLETDCVASGWTYPILPSCLAIEINCMDGIRAPVLLAEFAMGTLNRLSSN